MEDQKVEAPEGNPSEPSMAELESEAAAFLGVEVPTSEQEHTDEAEPSTEAPAEPTVETPPADPKVQAEEAKPADTGLSEEEQSLLADVRAIKEVTGTPFKGVQDVVKAWKEAQAELTRRSQATKPYEQLLSRVEHDPQFKQALEQLQQFYENPQLAQAYLNQSSPNTPPDPRAYALDDPEQYARYQKDIADYQERLVDSRIQTRLAPIETQRMLEQRKAEFKQQFPDVDPDSVIEKGKALMNQNPMVNVHKVLDYDNMKARMATMESEIRAKVTKELAGKIQTAGKTTTPQASAPTPKPSVDDIVSYVTRHGVTAATKKYGSLEAVEGALAEATNR